MPPPPPMTLQTILTYDKKTWNALKWLYFLMSTLCITKNGVRRVDGLADRYNEIIYPTGFHEYYYLVKVIICCLLPPVLHDPWISRIFFQQLHHTTFNQSGQRRLALATNGPIRFPNVRSQPIMAFVMLFLSKLNSLSRLVQSKLTSKILWGILWTWGLSVVCPCVSVLAEKSDPMLTKTTQKVHTKSRW